MDDVGAKVLLDPCHDPVDHPVGLQLRQRAGRDVVHDANDFDAVDGLGEGFVLSPSGGTGGRDDLNGVASASSMLSQGFDMPLRPGDLARWVPMGDEEDAHRSAETGGVDKERG